MPDEALKPSYVVSFPHNHYSQAAFEEDFEYVQTSGDVLSWRQLADWFAGEGYACCCRPGAAAGTAGGAGGGEGAASASSGGGSTSSTSRLYMWLDQYTERQLAPGMWLARWMELYQPFAGGWVDRWPYGRARLQAGG